jgi:molecular chaperone DnaK (HSP70)
MIQKCRDATRLLTSATKCYFVVFNLGAKESDLELQSIAYDVFKIYSLASDSNLGEDDFENVLLDHVIAQFNNGNIDITKDVKVIKGLRSEVEKAEQAVSTKPSAKIKIQASRSSHRFLQRSHRQLLT